MNRKGVMGVWLVILISIFIIALVYIIFSYVLYSDTNGIAHLVNTSTIDNEDAQATLTTISTVWRWWPAPLIIGLIIWGIVSSQRREPDVYY